MLTQPDNFTRCSAFEESNRSGKMEEESEERNIRICEKCRINVKNIQRSPVYGPARLAAGRLSQQSSAVNPVIQLYRCAGFVGVIHDHRVWISFERQLRRSS